MDAPAGIAEPCRLSVADHLSHARRMHPRKGHASVRIDVSHQAVARGRYTLSFVPALISRLSSAA